MKDEERGGTTEESRFAVVNQRLLKRLNGAIEKNEKLKKWIITAFPIMARAFSIVIQEHRLDEIPGCRGILESCPIVDNARLLPKVDDGWEEAGNPLRGWIPVEDRLPEWDEKVFVFNPTRQLGVNIAYLEQIDKHGQGWDYMDGNDLRYGVTHWRPLPCEPEGKEDK